MRIGFLPDMGVGLAVQPEVRSAAEAAATALAGAGCHVESIRSFLTAEMLDGMCRFFEARSYHDLMNLSAGKRERVLPFVAEWCSWRAAQFSGRDVMQAYSLVMAMREAAVAASQPYDFILSPTSPILAYEAELPAPGNDPRDALPHIAFTVPYNMSEQPAASINWSAQRGRPAGRHPAHRQALRRRGGPQALAAHRAATPPAAPLAAVARGAARSGRERPAPTGSCGWR